jgi:calcineurin-like phosphoesterase family protein
MTKKFYFSDPHFDHKNIINLTNRPFKDVDEMNETLVRNWNSVVTDNDEIYMLGDFAWKRPGYWFERLNGIKHFIYGNHDEEDTRKLPWASQQDYLEVQDEGKHVILFHYPITDWNRRHHGSYHLFGHVHGQPQPIKGPAFDVGAEEMGYFPRTLKEILLLKYNGIDDKVSIGKSG